MNHRCRLTLAVCCWTALWPTAAGAQEGSDDDVIIIVDEETTSSTASELSSATSTAADVWTFPDPEGPSEIVNDWNVSARASAKFDARVSLDTSFDRRGEQVFELLLGGGLELDVQLSSAVSFYAAPNFTYVAAIDREGDDREFLYLLPPEAYVSLVHGVFKLRLGSILFNWGTSDFIGPSDFLNPFDLRRNFLGFSELSKVPVIAAEATLNLHPVTLRAVVEPFFSGTRYFVTGWDSGILTSGPASQIFPLFELERFIGAPAFDKVGDQLFLTELPADRPDNATIGARASVALGDIDASASYIFGWDTFPVLVVDEDLLFAVSRFAEAQANNQPIPLDDSELNQALFNIREKINDGRNLLVGRYQRRHTFGFDVSWVLDPVVLKLDIAYTLERVLYSQDFQPKSHPWLNAVIGAEYVLDDRFQLIAEAFAISVFNVPAQYRLLFVEPLSDDLPNGDADRTVILAGLLAAGRYTVMDGDLTFEVGMAATHHADFIFLPNISYLVTDHHRLSLGGMLVEGRSGGYGQSYTHTDQVYVHYRFTY